MSTGASEPEALKGGSEMASEWRTEWRSLSGVPCSMKPWTRPSRVFPVAHIHNQSDSYGQTFIKIKIHF